MMLIDSEDVKQAIVQRLLEIFPNVAVYKEVKTNVVYPHFFVYQITVRDEEERKNYHLLHYLMDVRYRVASDPSTDLKLEQNLDNIGFKLLQNFNIINFESRKVKCVDKYYEKQEGVLHFFFTIDILAYQIEDKGDIDKMRVLELESFVKDGRQV